MFANYIKIACRNLVRNKTFSLVNIIGLASGLACSILIMLWIGDEKNKDGFHQHQSQLFQVYERNQYEGKTDASYSTQGLLAKELKRKIPEIQYACGLEYLTTPGTKSNFSNGSNTVKMMGYFAGGDFFNMFSYPLLAGNATTAIERPGNIAISKQMAQVFFGSPDEAMGKSILLENSENLKVTAVFDDISTHSSIQFDFVRNWDDFVAQNKWVHNWGNTSPQSFVLLKKNADPEAVTAKIKDFIYQYKGKEPGLVTTLDLQPYSQRYLYNHFSNGVIDGGRIEYVHLFSILAVFLLLIACINFMNLATARATQRAKEVGLRKVVGAKRSSLVLQFIGEAILLTALSATIALVVVVLLLPAFNHLTAKQMQLPLTQTPFWFSLLALIIVTGLMAGSYPALFLSSLNPAKVLKGSLKFKWSATFFRQGLVVFQFMLSIIMIVGMMVIYKQLNYIHTKNIGYNRDNLVYIPIEGNLKQKYELFKQQALQSEAILSVSKMRNTPTVIEHHTGSISWQGKDVNNMISFADGIVGLDFTKTLQLQLAEGRDFSENYGMDSTSYLLNETAVQQMGLKNPIGQTVVWGNHPGKVVGVLKDFHFNSLHQTIDPLILRLDESWSWGTVLVRVKAGKTKEAITALEQLSKSINPEVPFSYSFADEQFLSLYKSEQLVAILSNYFAGLAILISCLGLFGLATFTVSQRTKEIGLRKILGASAVSITQLLTGYFVRLVLIAAVIAFPLAWYVMNQWLQQFEYKIDIGLGVFIFAGGVTLVIALLTVSFQSIQTAMSNPIKSLRTE